MLEAYYRCIRLFEKLHPKNEEVMKLGQGELDHFLRCDDVFFLRCHFVGEHQDRKCVELYYIKKISNNSEVLNPKDQCILAPKEKNKLW